MSVSPEVLKRIKKVAFYKYEPNVQDVLWAKPVGDGTYEFYVYYNGTWNIVTEEEGVTINISDVTGDLSTFNNDAGFITEADIENVIEGASAGATALQPSDIADWAKQSSKPSYTASEVGALPDTTKYAGSQSAGGAANKAVSIPFGQVDSTSTATEFTATVDGITELRDGVCMWLRNGVVNSSSGCTININNLGAKPIYLSNEESMRVSGYFYKAYTCLFIYNTSRVSGGCWDYVMGFDSNNNDSAYKIRTDSSYIAYTDVPGIQLVFEKDNKMLAISSSASTNPNKVLTTESFNPFGRISVYTGVDVQAGNTVSSGTYWVQWTFDARRAFNISTSFFTPLIPVYLVVVLQSDNSVKLYSDPVTQTLPSTDDGLLYIFLGTAVNGYNLNLEYHHPIYYFKDGAIRQWTNSRESVIDRQIRNDLQDYTNIIHINTTAGTGIAPATRYDIDLKKDVSYKIALHTTSLTQCTIYFVNKDGNGAKVLVGTNTNKVGYVGFYPNDEYTITPAEEDIAKVYFYCTNAQTTGSNGCDWTFVKTNNLSNNYSKIGVVSQTQTWTGSDATGYDYTMSNLVYGEIPQANIDLFEDAGAVFNATTGYFELNGLTDISYQEMMQIYNHKLGEPTNYCLSGAVPMRTNIRFFDTMGQTAHSGTGLLYQNGVIESFNMYVSNINRHSDLNSISNMFYKATHIKKAVGINITRVTSAQSTPFVNALSLETLELYGTKISLGFENSSRLSLASVVYLVDNAANTSAITITLHATAFARCQADTTEYTYNGSTYTGIIAYAAAKSITIQSA